MENEIERVLSIDDIVEKIMSALAIVASLTMRSPLI